jgi:hypothetical protein
MPTITIVYGLLLTLLGLGGYFGSGGASITAMIPAFFGLPLLSLGFLARTERFLKHAMHGAAMLALLGLLGSARGTLKLPTLLAGGQLERPQAVIAQSVMAILSLIFLVLCIRSFIQARRARQGR